MKQITGMLLLALITLSCNTGYQTKYPYTIKDYSDSLQPYLLKALTLGMPGYDSAYHFLDERASIEELKKLTLSEHPSLRMLALLALIYKKGIDHYSIFMNHLDDSAMIATDEGEWGLGMKRVSDFMLERASWETKEKRNEAADILLRQHNNFHCAYSILRVLEPNEKYHAQVLEMVQRKERHYETETEYALWYLAQLNKKEDIPLIKKIMKDNDYYLEKYSFQIMEQYPDDSYLDILEFYAKHTLWSDLRRNDYHGDRILYFYKALTVYKNERAAKALAWLLKFIPASTNCNPSGDYCGELYEYICNNSCEAYKDLIPLVEPSVMQDLQFAFELEVDQIPALKIEESKEKYDWFH